MMRAEIATVTGESIRPHLTLVPELPATHDLDSYQEIIPRVIEYRTQNGRLVTQRRYYGVSEVIDEAGNVDYKRKQLKGADVHEHYSKVSSIFYHSYELDNLSGERSSFVTNAEPEKKGGRWRKLRTVLGIGAVAAGSRTFHDTTATDSEPVIVTQQQSRWDQLRSRFGRGGGGDDGGDRRKGSKRPVIGILLAVGAAVVGTVLLDKCSNDDFKGSNVSAPVRPEGPVIDEIEDNDDDNVVEDALEDDPEGDIDLTDVADVPVEPRNFDINLLVNGVQQAENVSADFSDADGNGEIDTLRIDLQVEQPEIIVEAPIVNVTPPEVIVEAPIVNVEVVAPEPEPAPLVVAPIVPEIVPEATPQYSFVMMDCDHLWEVLERSGVPPNEIEHRLTAAAQASGYEYHWHNLGTQSAWLEVNGVTDTPSIMYMLAPYLGEEFRLAA